MNLVETELQIKGMDTNVVSVFVPMMVTILFDHILDWGPAELKNMTGHSPSYRFCLSVWVYNSLM